MADKIGGKARAGVETLRLKRGMAYTQRFFRVDGHWVYATSPIAFLYWCDVFPFRRVQLQGLLELLDKAGV